MVTFLALVEMKGHTKLQEFKNGFDYPIQKGSFGQQYSRCAMKNDLTGHGWIMVRFFAELWL